VISNGGGSVLTKSSSGTLVLGGANSYSGGTIINAGILKIASEGASTGSNAPLGVVPGSVSATNIQFGGGTLETTASLTVQANRGMTLNAGGGTLLVDASTTLILNNKVDGGNALTLSGSGNITLNGDFGAATALSALTVNAGLGTVTLQKNITSTGSQIYNSAMTANAAAVTLTTTDATGDITLAGAVTIPAGDSLSLLAGRNIYLNANINSNGSSFGSLNLTAGAAANLVTSGSFASPSSTGVTANIYVNNFNLLRGQWIQVNSSLPVLSVANNFQINSGVMPSSNAVFIRALSGAGTGGSPYVLSDVYGLQGIGSSSATIGSTPATMSSSFNVGNSIDAAITSTWNSNNGLFRLLLMPAPLMDKVMCLLT